MLPRTIIEFQANESATFEVLVIPAARRDAAKADRRAHHTRRWRFMIESALLKYRKPMIELGF